MSVFKDVLQMYCRYLSIHAEAPDFVEMSVQQEVLETGIKVVDLLAPYAKGGKIGMYSILRNNILNYAHFDFYSYSSINTPI